MTQLRISEAAEGCGVAPSTLRYYERVGLLNPSRSASGYRVQKHDLDRLSFVVSIKRLGVPLDRIRELLGAWEAEPCRTVRARLRSLLLAELSETRARVDELRALEGRFEAALERLDELPDAGPRCAPDCALLAAATQ